MPRSSSLRLRMTLACAGLVVVVTTVVLLVGWQLLDHHLHRTLSRAAADDVAGELGRQYVLAVLGAGLVALGIAWAGAGRLLAPIHAVAATARRIGEDGMSARVRLDAGPVDELHDLAQTFDAMLDRVEGAVGAQRRFVANASHELRTPMTVIRTEAEVALDDPHASPQELRDALQAIVETGERTDRLLDALLVLASSSEGVPRRDRVDLAAAAGRALHALDCGDLDRDLRPVTVLGDDVLLERLVANLVENALRHGHDPRIALRDEADSAVLVVESAGEPLQADLVARLTEPFERGDRLRRDGGAGLGLTIVDAIARAHGGALTLTPRPGGGLVAQVRIPVAPARESAAQTPTGPPAQAVTAR